MLSSIILLASALAAPHGSELGAPTLERARRLRDSPAIWLAQDVLSNATVQHVLKSLPTSESRWSPCIGQTQEFASKRCTLLAVAGDPTLEAAIKTVGAAYDVDVARLLSGGLPIIRYLPGGAAVGVHGDIGATGLVPNATLVLYLTDGGEELGGATFFPSADLQVTPRRGSVLSFTNLDAWGQPSAEAVHGVTALSSRATRDRLVVQIPLLQRGNQRLAYPEHVSGAKHKGQYAGGDRTRDLPALPHSPTPRQLTEPPLPPGAVQHGHHAPRLGRSPPLAALWREGRPRRLPALRPGPLAARRCDVDARRPGRSFPSDVT